MCKPLWQKPRLVDAITKRWCTVMYFSGRESRPTLPAHKYILIIIFQSESEHTPKMFFKMNSYLFGTWQNLIWMITPCKSKVVYSWKVTINIIWIWSLIGFGGTFIAFLVREKNQLLHWLQQQIFTHFSSKKGGGGRVGTLKMGFLHWPGGRLHSWSSK